jgi:CubicO group peptidase (beta-lactamase class C family)
MLAQAAFGLLLWVGVSTAQRACDLVGQTYPPPRGLSEESLFQSAAQSVSDVLDQRVNAGTYKKWSFSVGVFSTFEDDLIYQYHHTSPRIQNSTHGTRKIDADSIYRLGSISKMLTVYLWLINDGDRKFNDPITDYLPALAEYAAESSTPTAVWEDVTVGDLAGQMAGLVRDCEC